MLIVIDGADGAGKETQISLLRDWMIESAQKVKSLSFPRYTETRSGQLLAECLAGRRGDFLSLDPRIASLIYAADRLETKDLLLEYLADGYTVLCDRFVSSNMIHQGAKIHCHEERREFFAWLDDLEHSAFGIPRPDFTIFLDVPFEVRSRWMDSDGRSDIADSNAAHQRAAEECAKEVAQITDLWQTVRCTAEDGTPLSKEDIQHAIRQCIQRALFLKMFVP